MGMENKSGTHKVKAPGSSYNWVEITPITRVIRRTVSHFIRPFIGVMTPFVTARGPPCTWYVSLTNMCKCLDELPVTWFAGFLSTVRDKEKRYQEHALNYSCLDFFMLLMYEHLFS